MKFFRHRGCSLPSTREAAVWSPDQRQTFATGTNQNRNQKSFINFNHQTLYGYKR
ncbi:MAG: hypothetical protein ACR2KX_16815 [Chitinophagaceae bacterium]